jgi:hypothetical protein
MRKWLAAIAAGITIAAGLAQPAMAVSGGSAVPTGGDPFLVRLRIGDLGRCTGTLIDPQWILTATSCFAATGQSLAAGPPATPVTATIGGTSVPVIRLVAHPTRGITLAKLPLRLTGATTVALGSQAPAAGESLSVAGFGRTGADWVPSAAQAAAATVRTTNAGLIDLAGAGVCKGDAGAPALRTTGGTPELAGVVIGGQQAGCLGESGTQDSSTAARIDDVRDWIAQNAPAPGVGYGIEYATDKGVGSFDLSSTKDRTVAFDYDHSGKQDYVLTYRPGSKYVAIARHNPDNTFTTVFTSTNGIGGFDLAVDRDRIVPFDYDHSGKLDYLFIYRPGDGIAFIVKHNADNSFSTVFSSFSGIGTYDLKVSRDTVIPYDYDHSGKQDYLLFYRPGDKIAYVVKHNADNSFSAVFASASGIGGYDLAVSRDTVVPYDYDHSGKMDALLLYRPGDKIAFVVKHNADNSFGTVFASFAGLAGFDLSSTADQITTVDYDQTGRSDALVLYRPGGHYAVVARHDAGNTFTAAYSSTGGLGPYDLAIPADRIVSYDADHNGGLNGLVITRPGNRLFYVMRRTSTEPASPPPGITPDAGPSVAEDGAYPGAATVGAANGITLLTGDGNIVVADCATTPVDNVGVLKIYSTDASVGAGGSGQVCFRVNAVPGTLNLRVTNVYEIRGDGQRTGAGHHVTAQVTTDGGASQTVAVDPAGSTQVGVGTSPDADPTALVQLTATA